MKNQSHISAENLETEFSAGNEAALEYLYDYYSGALFGVIIRMMRNEDLARDLLQDSFVKIWKNRAKFDSSKASLYTWMLNLTRNTCIDYLRSKRNKNQDQNREMDSVVYALKGDSRFDPSHIGVKDMLHQLPDDQRMVIEWAYFEGYTQKEISEEHNIPLGTVKSRAKAAMERLRKIFKSDIQKS